MPPEVTALDEGRPEVGRDPVAVSLLVALREAKVDTEPVTEKELG